MQLIGTLTSGRTIRRTNNTYTAERDKQHIEAPTYELLLTKLKRKIQRNKYAKSYPAFIGNKK